MSDPQLLELTVANFTAAYLVDDKINEAAKEAAVSIEPPGSQGLAGVLTGAGGWSVWARFSDPLRRKHKCHCFRSTP